MKKLIIDTAFNFDLKEEMAKFWDFLTFLKQNNIRFEIVQWQSENGWPEINYIGSDESLRLLLISQFGYEPNELDFEMSQAIDL